jgi:hypothetical protein
VLSNQHLAQPQMTYGFPHAQRHAQEVSFSDGKIVGDVTPPEKGHLAFFGELDYQIDGLRYHLSTQMRMTE